MPASLPRFAPARKARGVVAILAGQRCIWDMDEKEPKTFVREFLGPARVVSLRDRLPSCEWRCASCGFTVEDTIPIPVPAPCAKCNGIAFEAIEPVLQ